MYTYVKWCVGGNISRFE